MKKYRTKIGIVALCFFVVWGGAGCYLLKQGTYLFKYTMRAKPVEKLLKDPDTPDDVKRFLIDVQKIRHFAFDFAGLKRNKNYTRYVKIDKGYLVDVVAAAGKTSFEQYKWRFPIFGAFPYKGYFERDDALKEKKRLEKKGYDVYVRTADAFSTLGILTDPLYSFMETFSLFDLASMIIHEQTHATIFIKNNVQFNEELAVFVGTEGGLAFIEQYSGKDSEEYETARMYQSDYQTYLVQIRSLYDNLNALYESDIPEKEKMGTKKVIIRQFQERIAATYDTLFATQRFAGLAKIPINNAFLAAQMTYTLDLDDFYKLYELHDKDLKSTVAAIKPLRKKKEPKKALNELIRNLSTTVKEK